jgi:DNA-binding NarL/FixJ family response regulator
VGNCGPVLVVDDDPGIRELITSVLQRAGFETLAAADGDEAIELAGEGRPAAAVVDVNLGSGRSGYEICRELRDRFGPLPLVMVSGERTESFDRVAGLLLGADDYLVKPFAPDELVARVRRLVPDESPADVRLANLTARERDVLSLLARGQNQKEIAQSLVLSPKTVATHLQRILAKLGVHSRAQAVAAAHRAGFEPDDAEVVPHLLVVL